MKPESKVATAFHKSLGFRRNKYGERRACLAAVIHTTGVGPVARWQRQGRKFGEASPFETALRIYSTMMEAGPHYVVGQKGECVQLCPEDLAAWHVGRAGHWKYRSGVPFEWWHERWPDFGSPFGLAGGRLWEGGTCNGNTWGVDVVPPIDDPRGPWSDECWDTLIRLVRDVNERQGAPVAREFVITHSDAHPLDRTARGEPWDPGPRQWPGWEKVAHRFGGYAMCGPGKV